MIIGYVENKTIGENLDQGSEVGSDRAIHEASRSNIVLTDYLRFHLDQQRWRHSARRFATRRTSKTANSNCARIASRLSRKLLQALLLDCARRHRHARSNLRWRLRRAAELLRDYLGEELVRQEREHQEGRLFGLYKIFRDQVFHELTLKEFADAFAQMLAYGLFLARLNSDSKSDHAAQCARIHAGSFQLIHELGRFPDRT